MKTLHVGPKALEIVTQASLDNVDPCLLPVAARVDAALLDQIVLEFLEDQRFEIRTRLLPVGRLARLEPLWEWRHVRERIHVELARAHLLYGEWLRRERRRLDAREHLRTAHDQFIAMGMAAFGERAARELRATGETARRRSVETSGQLTAQESQIAQFARDGLSNPEIATRLLISPRTVEYHLHKVFTKLDISSRNELQRVLPSDAREAQPV
jgi:DNA-binding CsgD family transcriptional regulator